MAAGLAGRVVVASAGGDGRDLRPGTGVADAHGASGDLPGADPAGAAGQPEAAASAQALTCELNNEGAQTLGVEGQGGAEVEGPHAVLVGAAPGAGGGGVDAAQGGGDVVGEGGEGLQEGCVESREQEGVVGAQVLDEVGPGGVLLAPQGQDEVGVSEVGQVDGARAAGVAGEGAQLAVLEELVQGGGGVQDVGGSGQSHAGAGELLGQAGQEVGELDGRR